MTKTFTIAIDDGDLDSDLYPYLQAQSYARALTELSEELRKMEKYEEHTEEEYEIIGKIRDLLYNIRREYNIQEEP